MDTITKSRVCWRLCGVTTVQRSCFVFFSFAWILGFVGCLNLSTHDIRPSPSVILENACTGRLDIDRLHHRAQCSSPHGNSLQEGNHNDVPLSVNKQAYSPPLIINCTGTFHFPVEMIFYRS